MKPGTFALGQLVYRLGNAVHASLWVKCADVVLKMGDNGQQSGRFVRIGAIVSGKTIEQLHQFGVLHHPLVDFVHAGEQVELRDFQHGLGYTQIQPGVPAVEGFF